MLNVEKKLNGSELVVEVSGRLDTSTSPDLEKELKDSLGGVDKLILDFAKLEYISSAGLRVLLATQKTINGQGEMKIINVSETIMEIFDMTGFSDILDIEE